MSDKQFVFTTALLEKLESSEKRMRYYDLKFKGLLLEVLPSGNKVFRYRKTVNYKDEVVKLGEFPYMTVEQAREEAIKLNALLVEGVRFTKAREQQRQELTLKELSDFYFEQYAEGRVKTWEEMKRAVERRFEPELSLPLSKLDSTVIQMRINALAQGKHHHRANRALDDIKAILSYGVKKKFLKENPAIDVDRFEVESRTRIIQPHEFAPLMEAINNCGDDRMRDFFLICLYTGARSGNVKTMRWEHVHLDLSSWIIPKSKNGSALNIALSQPALEILIRREKQRELNPWVFPGGRPHQPTNKHIQEPKKMWSRIRVAAGVPDLRIHDLRRSLGSYMSMNQSNTATVMSALGHKSLQAAQIYQRVNISAVKDATEQAILLMEKMSIKSKS